MAFYNRTEEIIRIKNALARPTPQFIVVYGRRRCGKSTLLRHVMKESDVYYMATQADAAIQRQQFSVALDGVFPKFSQTRYRSWYELFEMLETRKGKRFTLYVDEFPYLVKSDTTLPSLLQRILENREY